MAIQRYNSQAIVLHWIVALLVISNFGLGLTAAGMELNPLQLKYISWHKWIGITVLILMSVRLLWRLKHHAPALPGNMARWERFLAHGVHYLLYGLLFAIPISGWLGSSAAGFPVVYLGLFRLPDLVPENETLADQLGEAHELLAFTMAALVLIHVAAALKHHFINRDEILSRMIPFLKPHQK